MNIIPCNSIQKLLIICRIFSKRTKTNWIKILLNHFYRKAFNGYRSRYRAIGKDNGFTRTAKEADSVFRPLWTLIVLVLPGEFRINLISRLALPII